MDLRKLQIFEAVARLGSFSAAAKELPMAQPAVSIAIQKLEKELGLQLLNRSRSQVNLTTDGEQTYHSAVDILQKVTELQQSTDDRKALKSGKIQFHCPSMLATYYFPDVIGHFLQEYPGLTANISQAGTKDILKGILNDTIEMGVISLDQRSPIPSSITSTPFINEQLTALCSDSHPWANLTQVDISAFSHEASITYEEGYYIRELFDAICLANFVKPQKLIETNFLPLILKMVKKGLGVSIGLEMVGKHEPNVKSIPISPATPLCFAIAFKKDKNLSRANMAFLHYLDKFNKKK